MLKKIAHNFLYYSGIGGGYKLFSGGLNCVVLAYHRVSPDDKISCRLKDMNVRPEDFEKQLNYLKSSYCVLPLAELTDKLTKDINSVRNTAAITFDDAYSDNYEFAFPILKKYGLSATIFVPTAFIESGRQFRWDESCGSQARTLTWKQMKEMSGQGVSFGAHTHNHLAFFALEGSQLLDEIIRPKQILEASLGIKVESLAYPYGEKKDLNPKAINFIREAGYKSAFTMIQKKITREDNIFLLPRIGVGGRDSLATFKLKLFGLVPLRKNKA